jgi:hypothetical protein
LTEDEIEKQKWVCYTRACQLVGAFQSLKPLVGVLFPGHEVQLTDAANEKLLFSQANYLTCMAYWAIEISPEDDIMIFPEGVSCVAAVNRLGGYQSGRVLSC